MATTIDTRPSDIDLITYAGDTLTLNITSPDVDYSTWAWTGQIKTAVDSSTVDAEFEFTHGEPPAGSTTSAVLSATDSANLGSIALYSAQFSTKSGPVATPMMVEAFRYSGVWDIQVENAGVVITLVRGTIKVDTDITRS
jgi:hypothetical protein